MGEPVRLWRPEFGATEFAVVMSLLCVMSASIVPHFKSAGRFQPALADQAGDELGAVAGDEPVIVGTCESLYFVNGTTVTSLYAIVGVRGNGTSPGGGRRMSGARTSGGGAGDGDDSRGISAVNDEDDSSSRNGGSIRLITRIEDQPAWAVPYGREFWRGFMPDWPAAAAAIDGRGARRARSMDDVMDSVSHTIRREGSNLVVSSRNYSAAFDADGFKLTTPAAQMARAGVTGPADGGWETGFRTLGVNAGGKVLFGGTKAPGEKYALCNTAEALLNSNAGIVERVEARGEGLVVSWALQRPMPADGDLCINAGFQDVLFSGVTSEAFHFGTGLRGQDYLMRHAVALDARGKKWDVAMTAEADGIVLRIPRRCLLSATQPLVIESFISPAFVFPSETSPHFAADVSAARAAVSPGAALGVIPPEILMNAAGGAHRAVPWSDTVSGGVVTTSAEATVTASLMEMRDRLMLFYGLAWNRVNDGIPYDRDTIQAQKETWQYLEENREARAARRLDMFQTDVGQLNELLAFHRASGYAGEVNMLVSMVQNFLILPFTQEGQDTANELEEVIRARLPTLYYAMQVPGVDPYVVFTTLRQAAGDAAMFHYYTTSAFETRMGGFTDWSHRLDDYDAHSNAYDAVRRPLFQKNEAAVMSIAEVASMTDRYLECIRTGANTQEASAGLDTKMNELRDALLNAPLAHSGDSTVATQMAELRLAYSELLAAKLDLSNFSSSAFDGAKVETLLASIEAKLRNARDEAAKQLTQPDESSWAALGIRNRDEARDVLKQRVALTEKFGRWLRQTQDWRDAVAQHPNNNFATLTFLTSFVRNKAEWDHLVVTEIFPVIWQYPRLTEADMMREEKFHAGSSVDSSVDAILPDLQEIWKCYGDY